MPLGPRLQGGAWVSACRDHSAPASSVDRSRRFGSDVGPEKKRPGSVGVDSLALTVGLVAACSSQPGSTLSSSPDNLWTVADEASKQEAKLHPASLTEDKNAVPGENAPAAGAVDKAGCTYIDWCDEPGSWGTVCIWTGCSLAEAVRECTDDANYVCGGITQSLCMQAESVPSRANAPQPGIGARSKPSATKSVANH